ncbi:MAG: carbon-nitrogen hydrolase family protein [Gammaproteobacteria bacterium]|nr:carbon-nitrogen hydrolase family protein [Gammaproteobacteria bacterium]
MSRVAVAQMVSSANLDANLAVLKQLFIEASEQQATLLVLPENCAFMGAHETDKLKLAESVGEGVIQATLSQLALESGLWVVAGTIPLKAPDGRVFASSLVFNSKGVQVARYDKIHLFDVTVSDTETHTESKTIAPGNQAVVVDTPIGCLGLSVCYDVRFPELYRKLQIAGAEVLTMVAAFTATTGAQHWHVLLKARAIENMCYLFASNQGGVHASTHETYGHSMIISPWGDVIAEMDKGTGIICADIDLDQLHARRAAFPCLKHRVL